MLRKEAETLNSRFAAAEGRAREAESRSDSSARQTALQECERTATRMETVRSELSELEQKIDEAQREVQMFGWGDGPRPSADRLLKDFKEKAGVNSEDVSVREQSEETKADLALEELKRRMGAEQTEPTPDKRDDDDR